MLAQLLPSASQFVLRPVCSHGRCVVGSYSIRCALLGRPHQCCWVDDVVITLVCIPLPHHSVVDSASWKAEWMRQRESRWRKRGRERDMDRVKWRSIRNAWLVSNEPPNHLGPWPHSDAQIDRVGRQQSATTLSDSNIPAFSYPKFIQVWEVLWIIVGKDFLTVLSAICHPWNIFPFCHLFLCTVILDQQCHIRVTRRIFFIAQRGSSLRAQET